MTLSDLLLKGIYNISKDLDVKIEEQKRQERRKNSIVVEFKRLD